MKKVLLIIGDWKPFPSPNSNCIEKLIDCLNDSNVDIVTRRVNNCSPFELQDNGRIRVYRIEDRVRSTLDIIYYNGILGKFEKIIKRMAYIFISYFIFPDSSFFWSLKAKSTVKKLLINSHYDLILTVSMPFICNWVVYKNYQNLNCPWVTYLLDPYSCNKHLNRFDPFFTLKARMIEKLIYEKVNAILATPELIDYDSFLMNYNYKVFDAPIPLLENNCTNKKYNNDPRIIIVFTGTLIPGIREPNRFLKIMEVLSIKYQNIDWEIHFYGNAPDFSNLFSQYIERYRNRFYVHGVVSRKEAYNAMINADFLLNIGNKVGGQVPSKIFEYMSLLKPIIHVVEYKNDTSIRYLEKYPSCCFINTKDDVVLNAKKIFCFLTEPKNILRFEELLQDDLLKKCNALYVKNIIEKVLYES